MSVRLDSPVLIVPLAVRDALGLGSGPDEPPALAMGLSTVPALSDLAGLRVRLPDEQQPALRARWTAWWQASLDLLGIDSATFPTEKAWLAAIREHRVALSGEAPDFVALADAPVLREAAGVVAALIVEPDGPSGGQRAGHLYEFDLVDRLLAAMDKSDLRWWEDGFIALHVLDVGGHYVRQFGPVVLVDRGTASDTDALRGILAGVLEGRAGKHPDEAV